MEKFNTKNKKMAVSHFRTTLHKNHADFETSTIGTEVGGGMQLDGAGDEVGLWKKTGYGVITCTVECTCTETDPNKTT